MKKHRLCHIKAAQHEIFLGKKFANPTGIRRYSRHRRNITAPDVLGQKLADTRQHFAILEPVHLVSSCYNFRKVRLLNNYLGKAKLFSKEVSVGLCHKSDLGGVY